MQNTAPERQSLPTVNVAVAVIERLNPQGQREILIAKRADDAHQGGLWEFPGGKIEPDETIVEALARELFEELGITVTLSDKSSGKAINPLIQVRHDYGDKQVLLDVCEVKHFMGEPEGKEGQDIQWVTPERLTDFHLPAANQSIVKACCLPRCYGISPQYASLEDAFRGVDDFLAERLQLILFRQPQLDHDEYARWSEHILKRYQSSSIKILLSGSHVQLDMISADGIHAPFHTVRGLKVRPVSNSVLFGVSCHDQKEIRLAEKLDADFITVSPVLPTPTHPDAVAMGWNQFAELTLNAKVPVFALGGLTKNHQRKAVESGAQGIAGIRLWQGNAKN